MRKHAAPIIAAILLLLPVLYVGSYFALVVPSGVPKTVTSDLISFEAPIPHYRVAPKHLERLFWPLEQIDQKLRPGAWFVISVDSNP